MLTVLPSSKPKIDKFIGTNGIAAGIEFACVVRLLANDCRVPMFSSTGDMLKGSAYMTDTLVNPRTSHSYEITDAPINLAFNISDSFYVWMNRADNEYRRVRFDVNMHGVTQAETKDTILKG